MHDTIRFINASILKMSASLSYTVADEAPGDEQALFGRVGSLVVWSGASDHTIYQDASVNHAFRAWHDAMHLQQRLGFSPDAEIELGRIQASQCSSALMAHLIYCEVAGQAEHFKKTGQFVSDQVAFTVAYMAKNFRIDL